MVTWTTPIPRPGSICTEWSKCSTPTQPRLGSQAMAPSWPSGAEKLLHEALTESGLLVVNQEVELTPTQPRCGGHATAMTGISFAPTVDESTAFAFHLP